MAQPIDTVTNALFTSLTTGTNFQIPVIDVTGAGYDLPLGSANPALSQVTVLTNASLTNAVATANGFDIDGTGTMDVLLNTFMLHLIREQKTNRITGAEYTKAFIAAMNTAAQAGVQYLLGRDSAYWQAQTAQMNLINSRVQLAIGKIQLANANIEANTAKVNYALNKAKIATENAGYIMASEQGETQRAQTQDTLSDGSAVMGVTKLQKNLLVTENLVNEKQAILVSEQGETARAQTKDTLSNGSAVTGVTKLQKDLLVTQNDVAKMQVVLVKEQGEAQRAQTSDTRSDGATVVGVLGKQKNLYTQQIESYKRDAEVKAGKMWVDAWITMKTIDEGLLPPDQFTNTEINEVLNAIKTNNSIGS